MSDWMGDETLRRVVGSGHMCASLLERAPTAYGVCEMFPHFTGVRFPSPFPA